MEGLVAEARRALSGRRVLVTGHTGFKGAWLTEWLLDMGAEVTGIALEPDTEPSLFAALGLGARIRDLRIDIRDFAALSSAVAEARLEVVFHLAAQALVLPSYEHPRETYETNVMGTVNVLEAVRACGGVRAVVNVTSDKCYENREWVYAYRENDPMGGFDPYSSSKGCAELVTAAWRRSFFAEDGAPRLASARAGNVIGGGDWALHRILPDCARALVAGEPIAVRNPGAVRPWQYVLEPLAGYLGLAAKLLGEGGEEFADGWNFAPRPMSHLTVAEVVDAFVAAWGSGSWEATGAAGPHEARFLKLDATKAADLLGWQPVWDAPEAIARAARWYRAFAEEPGSALDRTRADIRDYEAAERTRNDDAAARG